MLYLNSKERTKMNALEIICRIGVKGNNVPDSLERIASQDESLNDLLFKLKETHKEYTAELLSTQVYDDITDQNNGFGYGRADEVADEYMIKGLLLGEDYDDREAEDDDEAREIEEEIELVENFIQVLNELLQCEVSNIEIDFNTKLILIQ